jgi:prepilin-type N-terminal cleavage/methylation domain-containing protein
MKLRKEMRRAEIARVKASSGALVPRESTRKTAGFTLIETTVALTIFAALGYTLSIVVALGKHSQTTITGLTTEDRSLRSATTDLIDDLRMSSDSTITVTALPDGNHKVKLMQPIDLGGVAGWGVYDRTVAPNPMPNWHVQYLARDLALGGGAVDKQLVRQVLDDTDVVKKETVLANYLQPGNQVPPGFQMVKVGLVWQITLTTQGKVEGRSGIREVFHVQTRN